MAKTYIRHLKATVDAFLREELSSGRSKMRQAMRYAVLRGGKRLRPIILITAYESLGGKLNKDVLKIAASLELIHAFSLVQDDLPSLDNDDYRRGRLTTHKACGEAIALLASDALLNEAYGIILEDASIAAGLKIKILLELTRSIKELIHGQAADLALAESRRVSLNTLNTINRGKTAALLKACLRIAGIMQKVSTEDLFELTSLGEKLGLAYQILDDVLNVTSDKQMFKGKRFSDRDKGKTTYVSIMGIDRSQKIAQRLMRQAKAHIRRIKGIDAQKLSSLCDGILQRAY